MKLSLIHTVYDEDFHNSDYEFVFEVERPDLTEATELDRTVAAWQVLRLMDKDCTIFSRSASHPWAASACSSGEFGGSPDEVVAPTVAARDVLISEGFEIKSVTLYTGGNEDRAGDTCRIVDLDTLSL